MKYLNFQKRVEFFLARSEIVSLTKGGEKRPQNVGNRVSGAVESNAVRSSALTVLNCSKTHSLSAARV
jgi:hypothetical protein